MNGNYEVADNACVNGLDGAVTNEVDGIELGLEYFLAVGEYLVVVQDAEGCRQSAVVLVDDTSLVSSLDQPSILTYPNPTNGPFQITHMQVGNKSIQAIHSSGRIIMDLNGISATSMDMDLGTFAPGIYLIRIQSSAGTSMHRVILND